MDGWRQAASLVVIALAVLAALALTGAVTADDGEQPAAAATLQPTQVVAEIPEGYNQLFPLQWGGGSLFQLKSRLATMGCIVNTIWNYDGGEWHGYNQYNAPSTLNADWLSAYGEFVPAGSLFATCFDVCEFSYFEAPRGDRPCRSLAWFRASERWDGRHGYPIDDSTDCTDDFDERVKEHVLPSMPLYPGVCIMRQKKTGTEGSAGEASSPLVSLYDGVYPYYPSYVVVYEWPASVQFGPDFDAEFYRARLLSTEIHELCHTNQDYHFIEQMQPDRLINAPPKGTPLRLHPDLTWRTTKPGSSFIDLVGFTQDAAGDWSLPDDSSFRNIYSVTPTELAAELCSFYLLDRIGEPSEYEWPYEDFDLGRYLTDEIVEWIETWVALPAITGAEAD